MEELVTKKLKQETDFRLCILCQKPGAHELVNKPSLQSYAKFLQFTHDRGQYGDQDYPQHSRRLKQYTDTDLQKHGAKWHRDCYSATCHTDHLDRARIRHQKACQEGNSQYLHTGHSRGRPSASASSSTSSAIQSDTSRLTRSAVDPYKTDLCFFCQEAKKETVHEVTSFNAGRQLQKAVQESTNHKWKVQLSTAISADDARAIDVKYHLSCWVQNVQRGAKECSEQKEHAVEETNVAIVASDIEFINLVRALLQTGEVLTMTDLKSVYSNILQNNGAPDKQPSTTYLKEKITLHVDNVHFMKAKRRNESDRIFSTAVRDAAMEDAMAKTTEGSLHQLFDSATVLRAAIAGQKKIPWKFEGELTTEDAVENIPKALYAFVRWLIEGPVTTMETQSVRSATISRDVVAISQNIMYCHKSTRQIAYKTKQLESPFRHRLEWPQVLAVGIAVHQATRSKKLLDFLHSFGLSVDYSRILRLETQLANAVLESTREQGVYLPPSMHKGSFIFFAIDNSDFSEDTPDGKNTLHATAIAIYQRHKHTSETDEQNTRKLRIHDVPARDRSLKRVNVPDFVSCSAPNKQVANCPTSIAGFKPGSTYNVMKPYFAQDTAWLLSRTIMRTAEIEDTHGMEITPQDDQSSGSRFESDHDKDVLTVSTEPGTRHESGIKHHNIPTWAAYNSLLSSTKSLTQVNALPLIAAPAHEWQTLITVLKQTQQINCMVVGPNRKTVITLDMGLYERAKQLELSRDDCKGKWVLRLGEMHTVMAALRAIGNAIEDSGLEEAWCEADIYGPTTTRQIIEAKHMKRALEAHMTTVQALYDLYFDEFFLDNPHLRSSCTQSAQEVDKSCVQHNKEEMLNEQQVMLDSMASNDVLNAMEQFDEKKERSSSLFKFVRRYMRMVLVTYTFIRATRDGLYQVHISSLDEMCKHFFAHDKQKYARLVPVYLADMRALETTDPEIHQEFMEGNFTVHKNKIPFCAIGVDHALEHINRIMKVTGGLVGITQNASARERFFLVAPELSRLAEEANKMAGTPTTSRKVHHDLSMAVWTRQEENIVKLREVIKSFLNPMTHEGEELTNIITKVVMPPQIQNDICGQDEIGQQKYIAFVDERINTNEVNLWARMKKVQLKTWKSARKQVKHKLADTILEMKDDRSLFARMMIVARSRPEFNLKEAIGHHEFTVLPRALFAIEGTLLPCTDKSKLMSILEELPNQDKPKDSQPVESTTVADVQPETTTEYAQRPQKKVTVIDGMAIVQAMGKPPWIKTCAHWATHFISILDSKGKEYDEIHLVFDRYDLTTSLKEATREKRQGGIPVTAYHVEDSTPVGKLTAKQFLASTRTKDELTVYLAKKALDHYDGSSKVFIVTSRQEAFSNCMDVKHLCSSQEEADTKLILHSLDSVRRGATELYIQSPDTDVFILALRRYRQLCENTYFVTGVGNKKREISLGPVVQSLGITRTAALPGFHAFTGADQTGRFACKGKLTCWQALNRCPAEVLAAFAALGTTTAVTDDTEIAIEMFVCQLYEPHTALVDVAELRWRLFTKKQLEGQKLPPTRGALHEAIARAHFQAMVWYQDQVPNPQLPPPTDYGWNTEGDSLLPITTMVPPAPASITHLVKCGCKKNNCRSNCSCRSQQLNCSELCLCGADEDVCENVSQDHPLGIDDDEVEDDPSL